MAFARVTAALPLAVLSSRPSRPLADGDDVAVFLHGVYATGGVMVPLARTVERRLDLPFVVYSDPTGPGVEALAERLARRLARLPARARLHLVGHSLGGIVARWYALFGGDPRVVQTFSIGSPFGGVDDLGGRSSPWSRDLRPRSAVLGELDRAQGAGPPHNAVVGTLDHLIGAPERHRVRWAPTRVVPGLGHNGLLFDERVVEHLAGCLGGRRGGRGEKAPAPRAERSAALACDPE